MNMCKPENSSYETRNFSSSNISSNMQKKRLDEMLDWFASVLRLLKFTQRKNGLNTVYAGDSLQLERLRISLEVS